MISRGCTIENTFSFPFLREHIDKLYITYQQCNRTIIEKELKDCEFRDGIIAVGLSQEETLKCKTGLPISIQIRLKLIDGNATKSNIIKTTADAVLKDGVI